MYVYMYICIYVYMYICICLWRRRSGPGRRTEGGIGPLLSFVSPAMSLRGYSGTSLVRNRAPLGPYSRTVPRAIWWSEGGGAVSYD